MHLTASYSFDAPVPRVWALLMDTGAIASCIPGCRELRPVGEDRYEAQLVVGIAAVTGSYAATVSMLEKEPPHSFRLLVEGTGRTGFVRGDAAISLVADGPRSRVDVSARGEIGGAIARVGQRLIEGAGRMMMDRFFQCLRERV